MADKSDYWAKVMGKAPPPKPKVPGGFIKQTLDKPGKIIVLGVPKKASFGDSELEKHFSPFGTITEVNIIKDKKSGIPRGFAFITYENPKDAKSAIKGMEGKDIGGGEVHCEEAVLGLKQQQSKMEEEFVLGGRGRDFRGRGGMRGGGFGGMDRGHFGGQRGDIRMRPGPYGRGRGAPPPLMDFDAFDPYAARRDEYGEEYGYEGRNNGMSAYEHEEAFPPGPRGMDRGGSRGRPMLRGRGAPRGRVGAVGYDGIEQDYESGYGMQYEEQEYPVEETEWGNRGRGVAGRGMAQRGAPPGGREASMRGAASMGGAASMRGTGSMRGAGRGGRNPMSGQADGYGREPNAEQYYPEAPEPVTQRGRYPHQQVDRYAGDYVGEREDSAVYPERTGAIRGRVPPTRGRGAAAGGMSAGGMTAGGMAASRAAQPQSRYDDRYEGYGYQAEDVASRKRLPAGLSAQEMGGPRAAERVAYPAESFGGASSRNDSYSRSQASTDYWEANRPAAARGQDYGQEMAPGRPTPKEPSSRSAMMDAMQPGQMPRDSMMAAQRQGMNNSRAAVAREYPEVYRDPYTGEGQVGRQSGDQYPVSRSGMPTPVPERPERNGRPAPAAVPSNPYYDPYQRTAEPATNRMDSDPLRPMPGVETERRRPFPNEIVRSQAPETEMYASYPPSRPTADARMIRGEGQENAAYTSYSSSDNTVNSRKRQMETYPNEAARGMNPAVQAAPSRGVNQMGTPSKSQRIDYSHGYDNSGGYY